MYRIYDVEEVRYAGGAESARLNYEIMSHVVDSFPSVQGYTYVMHRSQRFEGSDSWEALDTWSVRKDHREVVVSEGNIAFVKMRFPVTVDNRWNGNTFNTLAEDEYGFENIGDPLEIDGTTFDKTVTVEQESNEDFIVFLDSRREVYASGVGLVFKETIQFNYCTEDACLGQQRIDSGIEMRLSIKEYGKH